MADHRAYALRLALIRLVSPYHVGRRVDQSLRAGFRSPANLNKMRGEWLPLVLNQFFLRNMAAYSRLRDDHMSNGVISPCLPRF